MIASAILSLSLYPLSLAAAPVEDPAVPVEDPAIVVEQSQPASAAPAPASAGAPPNPGAPPSEGVYAVGSSAVAPLPPAPEPVPASSIPAGNWRGRGWLSLRLYGSGPIAGETPARATVIGLGGGAEGGWRIRQWLGLGAAFVRAPHEIYRQQLTGTPAFVTLRGYMSAWDVAFLRFYAPVRGRIDPYIDLGGGLSFYDPARDRPTLVGGTVRASAGFEAWVTKQVTLGISGVYRANFVDETIGHGWQAAIDVGIHW